MFQKRGEAVAITCSSSCLDKAVLAQKGGGAPVGFPVCMRHQDCRALPLTWDSPEYRLEMGAKEGLCLVWPSGPIWIAHPWTHPLILLSCALEHGGLGKFTLSYICFAFASFPGGGLSVVRARCNYLGVWP